MMMRMLQKDYKENCDTTFLWDKSETIKSKLKVKWVETRCVKHVTSVWSILENQS